MLRFIQFIAEAADESKLTHLEHAEDHIINAGSAGFDHAVNTLHGIHQKLSGKKSGVSVSTKFDGSPSIVFGYHPENKRFFVASKSVFNKNPKLNYTHADIEQNHGHAPGLVSKLKAALDHLPKVAPNHGVYQGDFMYHKGDGDVTNANKAFHFKPNTITYSAKHGTETADRIKKAKIGVAVHTAYHGNSLDTMQVSYNHDLAGFKNHDDVHVISPRFKFDAGHYTPEAKSAFLAHVEKAKAAHAKAGDYAHLTGHQDHLKTYLNQTVKTGDTPSVSGYRQHLEHVHQKLAAAVKTPASKMKHLTKGLELQNHVDTNHKQFAATFETHRHLANAKSVLVDTLSGSQHEFRHSINGATAKPEGFVASVNNRPTKLVDRQEFSRANFLARPR